MVSVGSSEGHHQCQHLGVGGPPRQSPRLMEQLTRSDVIQLQGAQSDGRGPKGLQGKHLKQRGSGHPRQRHCRSLPESLGRYQVQTQEILDWAEGKVLSKSAVHIRGQATETDFLSR